MTHGVPLVDGEDSDENVVVRRAHIRRAISEVDREASVDPVITLRGDDVVVDLRGSGVDTARDGVNTDAGLLAAKPWRKRTKRAIDLTLGVILLLVLVPLLVTVAGVIKLTSPGPVLYVSDRVGQGERTFRFYKFRSMFEGSDALITELNGQNEANGPVFKIRQDPRITPVGRWLRKFSIDELPQFVNVIKGDMSLVGPRPPTVSEVAEYSLYHRQRLLVKPGLTCIWQTQGRSDVDFDEWIQMDLEYIENWSLGMDLRLLLATVPAVVSGRGAY